MYPEDRVLVGVINRKRDLKFLQEQQWYRIPQQRMPHGVYTEYLAFFLSGRVFGEQSGSISYYSRMTGLELKHRYELLPKEADHPRAEQTYYRVALDEIKIKIPPIHNPNRRVITFIHTTWDRFSHAQTISDLYSNADHFVERLARKLDRSGIHSQQIWEAEQKSDVIAPGLRIPCKNGVIDLSARKDTGLMLLDEQESEDKILAEIQKIIRNHGGPMTISIPPNAL